MNLQDLNPNLMNPRKITGKQKLMLAKSLKEFGDLGGFVFNLNTNRIVGGHQRQAALPPDSKIVIENQYAVPTKTGTTAEGYVEAYGERFKYREVKWDHAREMAANLAANKHGGEFDMKLVDDWMKELSNVNFDLELTGFDDWEKPIKAKEGEDDIPETSSTSIRLGDLFALGNHRLLCGDSTDAGQVARLMNGEKADMVFTDPPYAVNYGPSFSKKQGGNVGMQANYKESDKPLYEFLNLYDVPILIMSFPVDRHFFTLGLHLQSAGYETVRELIWCKPSSSFHPGQTYQQQHEPILICRKKGVKYPEGIPSDAKTIFHVEKPSAHEEHPTAKPMALWSPLLEWHSVKGSIIAEPFCGSGSTLIACEKTNRKCYGMEIVPQYCQVIIDRWEKFSGKKSVKIE